MQERLSCLKNVKIKNCNVIYDTFTPAHFAHKIEITEQIKRQFSIREYILVYFFGGMCWPLLSYVAHFEF
jgi:hypothetical protein